MSNWISVKERLPDEYEDYLVWIVNDEFYAKHPDIMTFETLDKTWGPHPPARKDSNVVTHWQPLPEPPDVN